MIYISLLSRPAGRSKRIFTVQAATGRCITLKNRLSFLAILLMKKGFRDARRRFGTLFYGKILFYSLFQLFQICGVRVGERLIEVFDQGVQIGNM